MYYDVEKAYRKMLESEAPVGAMSSGPILQKSLETPSDPEAVYVPTKSLSGEEVQKRKSLKETE